MKVTAFIFVHGDPSVGIPHGEINIDFGDWSGGYNAFFDAYGNGDGRKVFRKGLSDWATEWFDSNYVQFGDECPDCGHYEWKENEECPNKRCISRIPEEIL